MKQEGRNMQSMITNDKRIHIFTGHYGTGKSEVSLNFAVNMSKTAKKIVFADLDIINPYFRSSAADNILEKNGIILVTTKYANTNVDIPALTGEVTKYLKDNEATLIIDTGGDDAGAKVIGRYRNEIPVPDAFMYFVINCFRPETRTVDDVMKILDEIRISSKMDVDYIINNSHLMDKTTERDIITGCEFARAVSIKTGIPIAFHSVMKENLEKIKLDFQEPVFPMEKYMNMQVT
ncbi:MAG TPA: hypothetical protein VIL89_02435 [Clostridia bacterium]